MEDPASGYSLVMQLNRWDRTEIQLGLIERWKCLLSGRLTMTDFDLGYECVGWVPVFETETAAQQYAGITTPPAPVMPVNRRFDAP